ncbi:MAG: hypothetical protein QM767_17035 [Anaeromyxobacter sp.]
MILTALVLSAALAAPAEPAFKQPECKRAAAAPDRTSWSGWKVKTPRTAAVPVDLSYRLRYVIERRPGVAPWCKIDRIEWKSTRAAAALKVNVAWDLTATPHGAQPTLLVASLNSSRADDALSPAPAFERSLAAGEGIDEGNDMPFVEIDGEQPIILNAVYVKPRR